MRRTTLLTALLVGCSSRPDPAPPVPIKQASPAKRPTAVALGAELVGKSADDVRAKLGPPTGKFSGGWKYQDGAWDDDLQKHVALWVYFGTDGKVIRCD